jgi:hypothetical protein
MEILDKNPVSRRYSLGPLRVLRYVVTTRVEPGRFGHKQKLYLLLPSKELN